MNTSTLSMLMITLFFAIVPGISAAADSGISAKDKEFFQKAAHAGHAEVAAGKLAASKAANAEVKKFGQQMVQDHGKAGEELKKIAKTKGVTLPEEPDTAHQQLVKKLEQTNGAEFDRIYVTEAGVNDHEEAVALFTDQAKNGKDADLRAFAERTLPTIREHHKMAQHLAKTVKK